MDELKSSEYFPLEFTNITVVDAPLLKDYYWSCFNLTELNQHLLTAKDELYTIFNVKVPPMPVNSMPIKIILHMYNETRIPVKWEFKRIKLCDCTIQSVPLGINSFKKTFLCPHRELLKIAPTQGTAEAKEKASTTLYIAYRLYGQTMLAYELTVDKRFKLRMNFEFDIHEFDPLSCIITRHLFPVYIGTIPPLTQPVWIFNHYNQDMVFEFFTEEPSLNIVTKNLAVRRYSVTPMLVKYHPTRSGTVTLKVTMTFAGVKTDFQLTASGIMYTIAVPAQLSPRNDIATEEAPYTLFENYVGVKLGTTENSSTMVAVHNISGMCVQFKWRSYKIDQYFEINFSPEMFTCKPNHTVLCLVNVKAKDIPCVFFWVPLACEVYRSVQHATNQNSNVSIGSLDQPENTLITRLWLNMNFRIEGQPNIEIPSIQQISAESMAKCIHKIPRNFDYTPLEQIFWAHIFGVKFLHQAMNRKMDETTYTDMITTRTSAEPFLNRRLTIGLLRHLLADAVTEISKHWRFIPPDIAY